MAMLSRSQLTTLIHVGCKELGIDSETRRDFQLCLVNKASLKDMTNAEMGDVLAGLKERGFKPRSKGGKAKFKKAPRQDLAYCHVLWRKLGEAGHLDRPDRDGLNAFVRSQFTGKWQVVPLDIDALSDGAQINDVVLALKSMCRRKGVKTEL